MHEELVARLDVIERMLEEGRRTIERWAWVYVLWGVGHALGVLASFTLTRPLVGYAWGGLMLACGLATGVFARRVARRKPQASEQRFNRALDAVWWSFALIIVFLLITPPGPGTLPQWFAMFSAAYGAAFIASGHIVEWTPAKLNGAAWWAAAVAMKFLDAPMTLVVFGAMAVVGEIGFGLWAMAHERKVLAGGG
jgi:hypothetical protein